MKEEPCLVVLVYIMLHALESFLQLLSFVGIFYITKYLNVEMEWAWLPLSLHTTIFCLMNHDTYLLELFMPKTPFRL